jgi:type IV pilus assembly protein PilB
MPSWKKKIGQLLVEMGALTREGAERAADHALRTGRRFGEAVVELGLATAEEVNQAAAAQRAEEIQLLDLDRVRIDPAWAMKVPASLAIRRNVLPFAVADRLLYVACADPGDHAALEAVERHTGMKVYAQRAEPESLRRALERVYPDPTARASGHPAAAGKGAPVEADDDAVALSEELLRSALLRQASDIHLEPARDGLRVRFRVDGVLEEFRKVPAAKQGGLVSRFKVLGGMDIAEKRAPQDGGFSWKFGPAGRQRAVDIRLATLPTKYGERMTLRLLSLHTDNLTLERLGMAPRDLEVFSSALRRPHGILLLTGPTGSGKTTTLYAAIRQLDRETLNIMTIEDPIEYEIAGVSQVEVDSADKVTFSKALRSVLRHDPDVLMIGEIRDLDTADVAIKASLTGHLVFSTLHTNSAASTITRLIDMGVPAYLVAATLRLAVAQRLVRRLCPSCRRPRELTAPEAVALGRPEAVGQTVHDPAGCAYCGGQGYSGRVGMFEMMSADDDIVAMIGRRAPEAELSAAAKAKGMRTLHDDAAEKVLAGVTSLAEAMEVVEPG